MADGRELAWRLSLGPVLIAVLVALFWLDAQAGQTAPYLAVLAALLAVRSVWELAELFKARQLSIHTGLVTLATVAIVAANWLPAVCPNLLPAEGTPLARLGPPMLAYALAVMAVFVRGLLAYRAPGKNLERLGLEVLSLSYIGVFLSLTAQLRWVAGDALCYLPLASLVAVTKCGDTAAFFIGRAIGGRKLSPLISPGKTIAGGCGALVGGALGAWVCLSLAPSWFSSGATPAAWYWSCVYGVVIATVGIIGDLAESLIKRDVGRKDSAPLLPGFGGLLDLLDSVVFTGPAAYLLWLLLPLPR